MERASGSLVSSPMLAFAVAVQLLVAVPPEPDSTAALRALIDRAAERNRAVPASLHGYRAHVESEIAMLTSHASGAERAVSLEQAQSDIRWLRTGAYEQHVTAYRSRQAGPSLSAFALLRSAWTVPLLYGDRLALLFGSSSSLGSAPEADGAVPPPRTPAARAVHPLGPERDHVYTYSGGDTVAVLRTSTRAIAIVRVHVEPKPVRDGRPVIVFRGEIDLDAERGEIARMRGQFLTLGTHGPVRRRLFVVPMQVVAFVDLESIEVEGRYWLPRYQRIESHVSVGGIAEARSVFRIVSRFREHQVSTSVVGAGSLPGDDADTLLPHGGAESPRPLPFHRLTMAPRDSLQRPVVWRLSLGEATADLRGDDFQDVAGAAPVKGRTASLAWRPRRLAEVVHLNRVEGWSTGGAVEWTPGPPPSEVSVRANAGWAWSERTLRGRLEIAKVVPARGWGVGTKFGRTLDITNDFTAPHDSGPALAALVGEDAYDYVDRWSAGVWTGLSLVPRVATIRVEAGIAHDRGALARMATAPLAGAARFLPNRGVDPGRYGRLALAADWNPDIIGSTLAPGVGAQLRVERAAGQLEWQRATARLSARSGLGTVGWALLVDAGALLGDRPPPQQLFEVGGGATLPGYAYKEFAGDRALSVRGRVTYQLPVLRSPIRLLGCTCFTAPMPEAAITVHSANVTASSEATVASIRRLGDRHDTTDGVLAPVVASDPVSRSTDGWRSSIEVGVRLFGGAATVGVARRLEPAAPWRATFALGQRW